LDSSDRKFYEYDLKEVFLPGRPFFIFYLQVMDQQELTFSYRARYFRSGAIDSSTREVWFVIHGYGQLAGYFIHKFRALEAHNICVIAPEALSRFYLESVQPSGRPNDRVGATWMTKENRQMDIANYVNYLDQLYEKEIGALNVPVTVLGFSQGAATVSRWVTNGNVRFRRLILWAGILPPDMNFEAAHGILKDKETYLVYGKQDPFLADSRFAEMDLLSAKLGITPQRILFDGKHDIDEQTLLSFVR
jgi:predicted esterase